MVKRTGQNQITRKQREFVFREQKAFTPVDRNALYACEHILHQVDSIITGLKNFKEYRKYGAKLEGGMLIHGPKGTGKTTMAQLIATESGAHFVDLTLYPTPHPVWGPVDVAALFKNGDAWVKKHDCPLVYFIDQFDDVYEKQKKVMREFEIRLCGIRERCGGVFFILTSLKPPNGFDSDEKECTLFREGRIGAHLELSKPDFQQQVLLMQGFLSRWAHEENIDVRSLARLLNASAPPKALNKKRPQFLKRDCWKCCLAKFFPLPAATLLAWRTNTTLLCMKPDMRLSAALTDFRYMLFLLTHPPAELLASHWPVWIFPIMLWRIFSMVWRLVAEVLKRNSFWVLRPTPVRAATWIRLTRRLVKSLITVTAIFLGNITYQRSRLTGVFVW